MEESELVAKYPHYWKALPEQLTAIDVYWVLELFQVTDPSIAHAVKKLLCLGQRGDKDSSKDLQEAIDSLKATQRRRELHGNEKPLPPERREPQDIEKLLPPGDE